MKYGLKRISYTHATKFLHQLNLNLFPATVPKMPVSTRSKGKLEATTDEIPRYAPPEASTPYNMVTRKPDPKRKYNPHKATSKVAPKSATATTAAKTSIDRSDSTDLPMHAFACAKDFESFLDEYHRTSPGIWLKLARKGSGIPSVTTSEAVEVALCFGWINGQGKSFDESYYLARYTPRRPKSLWSELNVDLVAKLTEEGRMRPAGFEAVESAKEDGRWQRAYARPTDMVVPEDLKTALDGEGNEAAKAFFENLGKGRRYAVLHKVYTATPAARAKRVEAVVEGLAVGKVPGEKAK